MNPATSADTTGLDAVQRRVRVAARALGRHGLAHAYGHCSERLANNHFLVCAPKPMALLTAADAGTVQAIDGALAPGVLGEVRIHQRIYTRRADVRAIVRCMPPALMALGVAGQVPKPRHGPGAYFGVGIALWDDPQLVRDEPRAAGVADCLGACAAVVLRGNGVVVVGPSLLHALVLCWYLEDAARLELALAGAGLLGRARALSATQCAERATAAGGIFERMGAWLCAGDAEGELL
jgi:HCOMODA/2-hydroxy-3-carboxy-muconic semialdehyde decarboxylase